MTWQVLHSAISRDFRENHSLCVPKPYLLLVIDSWILHPIQIRQNSRMLLMLLLLLLLLHLIPVRLHPLQIVYVMGDLLR